MLSDMHCWLYQCPEADTEATALKKKKRKAPTAKLELRRSINVKRQVEENEFSSCSEMFSLCTSVCTEVFDRTQDTSVDSSVAALCAAKLSWLDTQCSQLHWLEWNQSE